MLRRIFAFIIDLAIANYLFFIVAAVLGLKTTAFSTLTTTGIPTATDLLMPVVFIASTAIMRLAFKRTLGEILSKVSPQAGDGSVTAGAPSMAQLLSRSLVSGLTLFFPYVWALGLFGSKRTITDRLTGTVLVHVPQKEEGEA